ncbi:MAG: exodeoxyribonuclease VII small subunit [Anaerolineae bacterium]|nr:MAG: exodeoxyribonuclease VII small subunit [Anaerolineae bacterium]
MSNLKPVEEMTYEETLAELQTVVAALEQESRPLDETIALYERGQALARHCALLLEKAELRVRQLNGENV